jgi:hypothetical protein
VDDRDRRWSTCGGLSGCLIHHFTNADRLARVLGRRFGCEVARGRPSLAPAVAGVRDELRQIIVAVLKEQRVDADELDVDLVLSVVEGLHTACCAPEHPLSTQRAGAVVSRVLELIAAAEGSGPKTGGSA